HHRLFPVSSTNWSLPLQVPANTQVRGCSELRRSKGKRNLSIGQLTNALIGSKSLLPLILSISENSTSQMPARFIRESLLPSSATGSVKYSEPASKRSIVDFIAPCGPSKTSTASALHPGRSARATALIIHRRPTARA